ncbi:MAG: insulinase family protein [Eubacteriales bacterium]|nr:insulinase family protein [Eubacteriales bacterium]
MILDKTLDNGLRIIAEKLDNVRTVSVSFTVNAGTVDEQSDEAGISHYIEHMVFKGTKNRTAAEIAMDMDAVGASLNAGTSRENTRFYAKVLDKHLPTAIDVISDMLLNPKFDSKDMELEKGVVCDEILMSQDDPDDLVSQRIQELYYGDDPLSRSVLGSEETVRSFTEQNLRDYMERLYVPNNMVVTCAGNFDQQRLVDEISEIFISQNNRELKKREYGKPKCVRESAVIDRNDLEQTHIELAYPSFGLGDEKRYALMAINSLLGGGMSSRLFQNIREKRGLVYSVGSMPVAFVNSGYLALFASTAAKQAETVLNLMLEEMENLKKNGITKKELDFTREQLKGNFSIWNEGTSAHASMLAKYASAGLPIVTEEQMINNLDYLTLDDVMQIIPHVCDETKLCSVFAGRECGGLSELMKK